MKNTTARAAFLAIAAALLVCLCASADEQAVGGPFVKLNDQEWTPEHPPIRMAGTILVPLRDFATAVGASVTWDQATKMVKITRDKSYVQMWVGRKLAVVNNAPEALSVPPLLVDDTLYVPVDPLAKAFGGQVEWDQETETLSVTLGGATYAEIVGTLLQAYAGPPPALLIFEKDTARYRAIALGENTQLLAGQAGQSAKPAKVSDFHPGDLIHVYVDDQGRAVKVVAEYQVVEGTVQRVEGKDILLDGGRIIKLLDTADIVDQSGKAASPDAIAAGAQIRARINPETKETAKVTIIRSAAAVKPRIRAVGIINPKPAYVPGETIRIRLIGTPGGKATVSLPELGIQRSLAEVKPGYYEAEVTLNLPQGQEKKVRIVANLRVRGALLTYTTQSFWVDGKPPTLTDLRPAPNSTVDRLRPTISVAFRDDGSGVSLDSVRMWLDGQEVTKHLTLTAERCSYDPEQDLSLGRHRVQMRAEDNAGHPAAVSWSFTIRPVVGQKILAVKHNAQAPLGEGETLRVNVVTTEEGRRCWAKVGQITVNLAKKRVTKQGSIVYAGTHEVKATDRVDKADLVAFFVDKDGRQFTMKADLPVTIRGDWPAGVRITAPDPEQKIAGEFRVRGRAKPGSTIRVVVTYYKKAFLTFQGTLAQQVVKADENGNWETDPIDPDVALIGKADTYTIVAELLVGNKVRARDQRVVKGD